MQGGFAAHLRMLGSLGADSSEVRGPEGLAGLDGLVIPGGESTAIGKALRRDGLDAAIRSSFEDGMAVLGTCAGMILADQEHLGLGRYSCERNAFGRQLDSFEEDLEVEGIGSEPMRAVFIRAPWVSEYAEGVEVLASVDGHPVALRDGNLLASAFHAELTDDSRFHAMFMAMATGCRSAKSTA